MTSLSFVQESTLFDFFTDLHRHPETAKEEFRTTEKVRSLLSAHGVRLLDTGLPTGLIAQIGGHRPGPVLALRCDMDALPVAEDSGVPYASEEKGKMHACGHDFHTTAVLGAALLLKEREDALHGTVKVLFQPGEEINYGAEVFLATGLLEDVREYYAIHTCPELENGTLGIRPGPVMAAPDRFSVTLRGRGAHGAQPQNALDPMPAMAALIVGMQTVVSRRMNPFAPAVVSVTHAEAGRTWNVIPDTAFLEGTVRTMTPADRDLAEESLRQMVLHTAASYGCEADFRYLRQSAPLINDEALARFAAETARGLGFAVRPQDDTMIGEDFAIYLERRPGCFIRVGTGGGWPLHHPKFHVDPAALLPTARYLAVLIEKRLSSLSAPEGKG